MKISARLENRPGQHQVTLRANDAAHSIEIPPKRTGRGSSVSGGELLFLALATCYCNDLYREAAKRGIEVESVEVEVTGDFRAEGEPAANVAYRAKVAARASAEDIQALMNQTDRVAEIHNTLRMGTPVTLSGLEAVSV
jgi:uncharacterized OsmC-like protein